MVRRTRHRETHDAEEWSLPKGHVEEGESYEAAARREVEEETGWRVLLGPSAGTISYQIAGPSQAHPGDAAVGHKEVRFWDMTAIARFEAPPAAHGDGEVVQVAWLRPHKAIGKLAYREQANLLTDRSQYLGASGPHRWAVGSGRSRRWRLEQALAVLRVHRQARREEPGADEIKELLVTAEWRSLGVTLMARGMACSPRRSARLRPSAMSS